MVKLLAGCAGVSSSCLQELKLKSSRQVFLQGDCTVGRCIV